MFDIGFSELLVIFVVALIILGPERLPIAAKAAGLWVRKMRRAISSVQREINAQLDQEELQQRIEQTDQRILKEGNDIQNMITPLPENKWRTQQEEATTVKPTVTEADAPIKKTGQQKNDIEYTAPGEANDIAKANTTETTRS